MARTKPRISRARVIVLPQLSMSLEFRIWSQEFSSTTRLKNAGRIIIQYHKTAFTLLQFNSVPSLLRQTKLLPPHPPNIPPLIIPTPPLLLINPRHTTPSPHKTPPITYLARLTQISFLGHLSLSLRDAFSDSRVAAKPGDGRFEV
jgi:hypothetical protein